MENNKKIIYLETGSTDPAYNLAFEEYVLKNRTDADYLMLWQNDNTIVIGQNQNTAAEINREYVERNNVHVVRRTTGGGAVYHDLGNLNYSFITDVENAADMSYKQFTVPVVEALGKMGLDAEASGRNDILVNGCKISGTAQRLQGNRMLFHGTLLFDSDMSRIAGALNADPIKFQSKSTKSVRSRVGNIRSFLDNDMSLADFWDFLKGTLGGNNAVTGSLSEDELSEVQKLKETKYDTYEWTYGRSPHFTVVNKRKWDGGILETGIEVDDGAIENIRFYGDFLSLTSLDEAEQAMKGCRMLKEALIERLGELPLDRYFGSITAEEIAETILG